MPAVPKLIADVFEPRFGRPCQVSQIDELDSQLRRVRFSGRALQGLSFRPGQEIEFRVDATAFRHYTPSAYDPVTGAFDVVFYLHDGGPGSRWAARLAVGDHARLLGPGGRFGLGYAATHVLVGDETCLGLFTALASSVAPAHRVTGAIEVASGRDHWPALAGAPVDAVHRTVRGAALRSWLAAAALDPRDMMMMIYVAGHADTVGMLRDVLRAQGWPRSAIRTKPYWADGKRGL